MKSWLYVMMAFSGLDVPLISRMMTTMYIRVTVVSCINKFRIHKYLCSEQLAQDTLSENNAGP